MIRGTYWQEDVHLLESNEHENAPNELNASNRHDVNKKDFRFEQLTLTQRIWPPNTSRVSYTVRKTIPLRSRTQICVYILVIFQQENIFREHCMLGWLRVASEVNAATNFSLGTLVWSSDQVKTRHQVWLDLRKPHRANPPNSLVQYGIKRRPTFLRMSCRELGEACLTVRVGT